MLLFQFTIDWLWDWSWFCSLIVVRGRLLIKLDLKGINSDKTVTKSGVVSLVSSFYESPHVTSKCDHKAIANIFAGLEITEVVL